MINYKNGKIYKIEFDGYLYVGSTAKKMLCERRGNHVRNYAEPKNATMPLYSTIRLRENLWQGIPIILLEAYSCSSKDELWAREQHWIDKLKPNLNRYRAFITAEEAKVRDVEKQKEYLQQPHVEEARRQWERNYRLSPGVKEKNNAGCRDYYERNKEWEQERCKDYARAHEEERHIYRTTRVNCPTCNLEVSRLSLKRHMTRKHT